MHPLEAGMRQLLALTLFTSIGLVGASEARAAVAFDQPNLAQSQIQLVADGCGPGGFRGPYGRCHYPPPPPRYYRGCPPGTHPTPYGCRPNY